MFYVVKLVFPVHLQVCVCVCVCMHMRICMCMWVHIWVCILEREREGRMNEGSSFITKHCIFPLQANFSTFKSIVNFGQIDIYCNNYSTITFFNTHILKLCQSSVAGIYLSVFARRDLDSWYSEEAEGFDFTTTYHVMEPCITTAYLQYIPYYTMCVSYNI